MKSLEPRDLKLALILAGLWPVAWLLPERLWPRFCALVTGIKQAAPWETLQDANVIQATLAPALGPVRTAAIGRDLDMHRHLLRLAILRCLAPGGWHPRIEVEGLGHLGAALDDGRGAILWMAHFIHNGLVGKMALHASGYEVHHLSRPEHGFSKTRFGIRTVNRVRVRAEDPYLAERIVIDHLKPLKHMQRLLAVLTGNGIVSITAGAWEGRRVVEARTLERRLPLANGAPAIAHRTGAALLPVVGCRLPDGDGFRVEVLPRLPIDPEADRAEQVVRAAGEFLERTEPWIRRYPEQWRGWSKLR